MSDFRFELNYAGVGELLKGEAMQGILKDYAQQVQGRCSAGSVSPEEFGVETKVRGSRAVATVKAATPHAYRSNLKHNTILKAVGGG